MCNCTLPSSAAIQTGIFPDFTVKEALVFPSHLFSSSVQIFGKPYSHEAKLRCKCSRFTEQSCLCIPSSWGVISILHFANKGVLIFLGGVCWWGFFPSKFWKPHWGKRDSSPVNFFLGEILSIYCQDTPAISPLGLLIIDHGFSPGKAIYKAFTPRCLCEQQLWFGLWCSISAKSSKKVLILAKKMMGR